MNVANAVALASPAPELLAALADDLRHTNVALRRELDASTRRLQQAQTALRSMGYRVDDDGTLRAANDPARKD